MYVLTKSYLSSVAAGTNTGLTLTYIVGYLASHPEFQEEAYREIKAKFGGAEVPELHGAYDIDYVRALHMVRCLFSA